MRSPNGHIRIGIDVSNTGFVNFWFQDGDPVNAVGSWKNRINDTAVVGDTDFNGDIQHLYMPQPAAENWVAVSNLNNNKYMRAINPYGMELTRVDLKAGDQPAGITFGKTLTNDPDKYDVLPSHEYAMWVWVSLDEAFTSGGGDDFYVSVDEYTSGDTLIGEAVNVVIDFPNANEIVPVYLNFTTDPTTDHVSVNFVRDFTSATSGQILFIHGIMVLDGDVPVEPYWNAGNANSYLDEITEYVKNASGSIGKSNWEQILFDEGNLTISLDNQDRIFSVENPIHSPYFARLKPHQRVWVLFGTDDDDYRMLWSGWTHQLQLETGIANSKGATITARQGKYAIEAQDPALLVPREDGDSSEVIVDLFEGGYEISTGSDIAGEIREPILEDYSLGVHIPLFGTSFVGDATRRDYIASLENVSEINGNYLFLTRYGRVFLHTFEEVRDTVADELPFNYTTNIEYTYAPIDLYKNILVIYDKYFEDNDVEMQGVDQTLTAGVTDFKFKIHPQYNGRPLIGDVVLDVSAFQPVDYTATPAFGTANATPTLVTNGIYTYYDVIANNTTDIDYRLSFVSRASGDVWYAQETAVEYELVGDVARGLETLTYNNPLVTSEFMAEELANLQKARRTNILSWYNAATLTNRSNATLEYLLDHTLGDTIWIIDPQTGNIPKHTAIIGESWTYDGSYLQMTYNLAPTAGVVDPACVAEFTWDIESDGLTVTFQNESASSIPIDIIGWVWDFGDSNTSSEENPVHTYATDGTYTVTLTLLGTVCFEEQEHDVTVSTPTPPFAAAKENIALFLFNGGVARTSNALSSPPTWDYVDFASTYGDHLGTTAQRNFTVDYASPDYITGSGGVNGWIIQQNHSSNQAKIYLVEDIFGTPALTLKHTMSSTGNPPGKIRQNPLNADHLIARWSTGSQDIWTVVSFDRGETWTETLIEDDATAAASASASESIAFSVVDPDVVFMFMGRCPTPGCTDLAVDRGIYKSTDGGLTFSSTLIDADLEPLGVLFVFVPPEAVDDELFYVSGLSVASSSSGVSKYDHGTVTNLTVDFGGGQLPTASTGSVDGFKVSSLDPDYMAVAGGGTTSGTASGISEDGGATWTPYSNSIAYNAVIFADDDTEYSYWWRTVTENTFGIRDTTGDIEDKTTAVINDDTPRGVVGIAIGIT